MESAPFRSGKYPFVGLSLAAIAGIWLADFHPLPWLVSASITAGSFLAWAIFRKTSTLLILVASTFFLLHAKQFDRNPARQLAQHLGNDEITITGSGVVNSVPAETISSNGKARSQFQIKNARLDLNEIALTSPLSVLVNWPNTQPKIGDRIQFEGNLKNLTKPRNPGEFDYAGWLARQQIFSQVSVPVAKNAHLVETDSHWNARRLANETKLALANIITRDITQSPIEAGIISAMMLGAKDDTPDATLELFMKTGTFHLFSVSGLHVTMLAAITLFIFITLRIPRRIALLLTIPAVFVYAFITGWSPSSVRAAMMTSAFVLATLLDRPSLSINTLAVSCFIILLTNTNQLFAASFQLSFTVVAAIILTSGPITHWLQNFTHPDPFIPKKLLSPWQKSRWLLANKAGGSIGLTLSAWIGSLPLTAYYFNIFSPVALVANLLIIPLAFAILTLGVLSVCSALFSSWLVIVFNNASWGLVKVMLAMLGFFTSIPGSSLFVGPHWWQMPDQQRVTFFDLGSGGAKVIETSSSCWLVDCGSDADYRRVVRQYLQKRGINRVDGIFLTHGDSSHIGGIRQFRSDFPQAQVYLPEAGKKSLAFRRLVDPNTVQWISRSANFRIDEGAHIEVLWPPPKIDSGRDDDHSLVLNITLNRQKFLLIGDSGFNTEIELTSNPNSTLKADWLVMGRNRNDPGASQSFLQAVGAKSLLNTAANFPSSEKIPPSLVQDCQKLNINLLRFDETGAVQILLQNGKTEVLTFAQTNPPNNVNE